MPLAIGSRVATTALLLFCLASPLAQAHARLKQSEPTPGSSLARAPDKLTLTFTEPATLTAVSLRSAADSKDRKLALPRAGESASHVIALPPLPAGDYVVTWRALSDDTHVTSGTVKFSVRPSATGQ